MAVLPIISVSMSLDDAMREYLMTERQAILLRLEAIEKVLGLSPRTSEIRKAAKATGKAEQTYNEIGKNDGNTDH